MTEGTPVSTTGIMHIAVAGNIGVGKTSLSGKLSEHYGWQAHYENAMDNPYLSDFYHDMQRWSFNLQIYFLNSRYKQIMRIREGDHTVIQDRTIYEDAHIFAANLHEMGLMSQRDYENYLSLFSAMASHIKPPDLMIYLKASIPTLVGRIQIRGREYEGNMSLDYLRRLNEKYDSWIDSYDAGPLLIINADKLDFESNQEDLGEVISMVDSQINGLFQ